MRTLKKALNELSEEGMGWSHLDIRNLILELTGDDDERLNLMLLDIDKLMAIESYKLDLQDINDKKENIEPDTLELIDRSKYYVFMVRVRRAIRDKLNLDFINRVHENRINWLRSEISNRAFIEALIQHGYISNKNYFSIRGNFIEIQADDKETKRIDWLENQRVLIMMINHLITEGIIGPTDNKWMMVKNHFTHRGREVKTDSLANDSYYLHDSKITPKGWVKLKSIIDETLAGFI
jgi:hypothetical protein